MRRRATLVTGVTMLAILLSASLSAAQVLYYGGELSVYDATGRKVGAALATSAVGWTTSVTYRIGSDPVIVAISRQGLLESFVFFQTPDCSGQVFVATGDFVYPTVVVGARKTVYRISGDPAARVLRSALSALNGCEAVTAVTYVVAPVTSTGIDLVDLFRPPFSLRMGGAPTVPR